MEKLIITVAPTGSLPTPEMTPHVPVTPEEIAKEAFRCRDAGASIIHVHARKNFKPTSDVRVFSEIMQEINYRCPEIIVQISTGGRGRKGKQRGSALKLKPEMASLTTGSVNFPDSVYSNPPELIEYLASEMMKYSIKPECEIFDAAMVNNALMLKEKGLIKGPLHFNFVLGLQGAIPATPRNLHYLVESIPANATWSVSGIGKYQLQMNELGIAYGGHARTGIEDNIYYAKGDLATNARLVERLVRMAREVGREVATPDEARKILGLEKKI